MHSFGNICSIQRFFSQGPLQVAMKKILPSSRSFSSTTTRNQSSPIFVCIVGAGPAGYYAADTLLKSGVNVEIDFLERLPTPFGLLRYGVAPGVFSSTFFFSSIILSV